MIIGLGTDLCENYRIEKMYKKFGDNFLNRIFSKEEVEYCLSKRNPIPHLTARFALKEAFIKALNLKRDLSLSYKDVYLWGPPGKKNISVSGKLETLYKNTKANKILFSISHAKEYSSAMVILEYTNE